MDLWPRSAWPRSPRLVDEPPFVERRREERRGRDKREAQRAEKELFWLKTRRGRQARLVRKAKGHGGRAPDKKARDALLVDLAPFVKWQAERMWVSRVSWDWQAAIACATEDLIQEGLLGIADAIKAYTPSADAYFATYALKWARGRMLRALANNGRSIRVPEYRVRQAEQMRKVRAGLEQLLDRAPTEHEIAEAWTVLPVEEVRRLAVETATITSLDTLIEADDQDEPPKRSRYLEDPAGRPETLVHNRAIGEGVREALRALPRRDRRVLHLRYWGRNPRRVVAERLGITEKAVHGSKLGKGLPDLIAVVSAVDPLLRLSASWVNRLRHGVRCGIVQPPNMTMGQYHCTPLYSGLR